jgi:hypothetical protein
MNSGWQRRLAGEWGLALGDHVKSGLAGAVGAEHFARLSEGHTGRFRSFMLVVGHKG